MNISTLEKVSPRPLNSWEAALQRLQRNRAAVLSTVFLFVLFALAIFADFITPYPPDLANFAAIRKLPDSAHMLGTDEIGRDILTRLIYGARISLLIGLSVQIITTMIGVAIGLIAGYYGGLVDGILMRVVDIFYAMPQFLLAIFIISLLQPTIGSVIFTLVVISWTFSARLTRGQVLSLKTREYVTAAEALGSSHWHIMRHHILPNALSPLIVQFTVGIVSVIMAEAALSFLGIGIRPPNPTWGGMINKGREFIRSTPHLAIYPSILLGLTAVAFNFLGDGLRDALDTRLEN